MLCKLTWKDLTSVDSVTSKVLLFFESNLCDMMPKILKIHDHKISDTNFILMWVLFKTGIHTYWLVRDFQVTSFNFFFVVLFCFWTHWFVYFLLRKDSSGYSRNFLTSFVRSFAFTARSGRAFVRRNYDRSNIRILSVLTFLCVMKSWPIQSCNL